MAPQGRTTFRPLGMILLITSLAGATGSYAANVPLSSVLAGSATTVNLSSANTYTGGDRITRNIVIEGNGAVIDLDASGPFNTIQVINGARLTIRNVTVRDAPISCFEALTGSTLILENVTTTTSARAVICDNSTFNATNSTLDAVATTTVFYRASSTGTLTNCTIRSGEAFSVEVANSTVSIVGGLLSARIPLKGYGVEINNGSVTISGGTRIEDYLLGVHSNFRGNATIRNAIFRRCGEGIYMDDSDVLVEDTYIYDNRLGQGLKSEGDGSYVARRVFVSGAVESGAGLDNTGVAILEDCYFENVTFGGISVTPTAGTTVNFNLLRNTIRSASPGIFIDNTFNGTVSLNGVLDATSYGIQNRNTASTNNTFERNFVFRSAETVANTSQGGSQIFRHNFFHRGRYGFLATSGTTSLLHNEFTQTGSGPGDVYAAFFAAGATLTMATGNTFTSSSNDGLYVTNGSGVAPNNWWGVASGPNRDGYLGPGTGSQVTGASFTPWLTADPIRSGLVEVVNVPAGSTQTVPLVGELAGAQLELYSPTAIANITPAAWTNRTPQVQTAYPSGDPVYMTIITDARFAIERGTVKVRLQPAFVSSFGFIIPQIRVAAWNESTKAWNSLTSTVSGGSVVATLPHHSATIALYKAASQQGTNIGFFLKKSAGPGVDMNGDGRIDAADMMF